MIVNIHSIVDLITNSSSEIYTNITEAGIQVVKDIFNEVLRDGGSNKTADDLYNFYIIPFTLDYLYDEEVSKEVRNVYMNRSDNEICKYLIEHEMFDLLKLGIGYHEHSESRLLVYKKGGVPTNIGSMLSNIFEQYAEWG